MTERVGSEPDFAERSCGRFHCAAGAWHGRGLVCYASSGKEGNRRLPEHALYDLRSVARRRARPAASAALNSAGPVCAYALISPCAAGVCTPQPRFARLTSRCEERGGGDGTGPYPSVWPGPVM